MSDNGKEAASYEYTKERTVSAVNTTVATRLNTACFIEALARLCTFFSSDKNNLSWQNQANQATLTDIGRCDVVLTHDDKVYWASDPHKNENLSVSQYWQKQLKSKKGVDTEDDIKARWYLAELDQALQYLEISEAIREYLLQHLNQSALLAMSSYHHYYRACYLEANAKSFEQVNRLKIGQRLTISKNNDSSLQITTHLYCYDKATPEKETAIGKVSFSLLSKVDNKKACVHIDKITYKESADMPAFFKCRKTQQATMNKLSNNTFESRYSANQIVMASVVNKLRQYRSKSGGKSSIIGQLIAKSEQYIQHKAHRLRMDRASYLKQLSGFIKQNGSELSKHRSLLFKMLTAIFGCYTIRLETNVPSKKKTVMGLFYEKSKRLLATKSAILSTELLQVCDRMKSI